MTYSDFVDKLEPICDKFAHSMNGRYREHVSDAFISAYLSRTLAIELISLDNQGFALINVAYSIGCRLFESMLEHGCHAAGNGHHVAQKFAEGFTKILIGEIEKQTILTVDQ